MCSACKGCAGCEGVGEVQPKMAAGIRSTDAYAKIERASRYGWCPNHNYIRLGWCQNPECLEPQMQATDLSIMQGLSERYV